MSQPVHASNITEGLYQPNVEGRPKNKDTNEIIMSKIQNNDNTEVENMTHQMKRVRRKVPFWGENPNVLLQQPYLFEFFPSNGMCYEQKLNAITRSVIAIAVISIIVTKSTRTLLFTIVTLGAIYTLYQYHQRENEKNDKKRAKEAFTGSPVAEELFKKHNMPVPEGIFTEPDSSNPFGNVLVTDYDYNPDKKPAPPSFNKNVEADILTQAKQFVTDANPDHPDIAEKLFKDAGSELMFEQSLRPFSSNPSTTIPNDQAGFAEFCYGSMISCKEGNQFACARNLSRHTN
jgi:hypothetical protein